MERIKKHIIFVSITIAILLNIDKIILGDLALITTHDAFDSNFPFILAHAKNILKYGIVSQSPQQLCGISSYVFAPILSLNVFTQLIFNFYFNYLFYSIFIIFIAFLGMFLLLNDELSINIEASIVGALFYIAIPIWLPGNISVAGIPLLIWSIERIFDDSCMLKKKIICYIYIIIYLFSSFIHFIGFAILPFYLTYFLFISKIKKSWRNIFSLCLIWTLYMLINLPYMAEIYAHINDSHRAAFILYKPSWLYAFKSLTSTILLFDTQSWYITIPSLLGLFIVIYYFSARTKKSKKYYFILTWIISIEIFTLFVYYTPLWQILKNMLGIFGSYDYDQFYYLLAIFFSIILGISSEYIIKEKGILIKKPIIIAIITIFIYIVFGFIVNMPIFRDENIVEFINTYLIQLIIQLLCLFVFLYLLYKYNKKQFNVSMVIIMPFIIFLLLNTMHSRIYRGVNNFRSYFYSDQIDEIKKCEGNNINKFRVVRVGNTNPAQLLFHGFNCADGYVPMYPKSYKELWAQVISPELKHKYDSGYFITWGNLVCLFDSINQGSQINELSFKPDLLKLIGVKYLFSDKEINNYWKYGLLRISEPNLKYLHQNKWLRKIFAKKEYYIYRNHYYAEQVFLTGCMKILDTKNELLRELGIRDYQYLKINTLIVKNDYNITNKLTALKLANSKINSYSFTPDKITININNQYTVLLNCMINYHPNWICKIDGRKEEIFRIYNTFMGVIVPANSHEIELQYINPYLNCAYLLFIFGFTTINAFILINLYKNSKK